MRVQVYMNLHTGRWSIRSKATGRVVDHADNVLLHNARFRVQEGGRQRVINEGRKNVHAWVEGDLVGQDDFAAEVALESMMDCPAAYYNPYKTSTFVNPDGLPVEAAQVVAMSAPEKTVVFH